jgi:hypothetical protein
MSESESDQDISIVLEEEGLQSQIICVDDQALNLQTMKY